MKIETLRTYIGMCAGENEDTGDISFDDDNYITSCIVEYDDDSSLVLYDAFSIAKYIFKGAEEYDIRAALNTQYEFDDNCCFITKDNILEAMTVVVGNSYGCRMGTEEINRLRYILEDYADSVWRAYETMYGGDGDEEEL